MRFIIGILLMAVVIGACTTSGTPVAQQTLGDQIEQVKITPDVEQLEKGEIQIVAQIGVSACGTGATSTAIGNCDVPEELLCDDSGTRECSQDCEDHLRGSGSCLVDWMVDNYDGIDSTTNSRNWCFKTQADYNSARECLAGESEETVDEVVACTGTCKSGCGIGEEVTDGYCPLNEDCCVDSDAETEPIETTNPRTECINSGGFWCTAVETCVAISSQCPACPSTDEPCKCQEEGGIWCSACDSCNTEGISCNNYCGMM